LSSTAESRFEDLPSTGEQELRVTNLRADLRDGRANPASFPPTADNLAVLSSLCFDLLQTNSLSQQILVEASGAYELVAAYSWPDDDFGEQVELSFYFAFIAWRHATALGVASLSERWRDRCEREMRRESAFKECLECLLAIVPGERSERLTSGLLNDGASVLALCLLLRSQVDVSPKEMVSEGT